MVNDRVHITDIGGTTQIFRMDKTFQRVGEADLGEDSYATPAFMGGRIYIRGLQHLFCVEERK